MTLTEARKTLAAAMKSSVFPLVQDPIYTLSILTSLHSLAKARLSGECGWNNIKWIKISSYRGSSIFILLVQKDKREKETPTLQRTQYSNTTNLCNQRLQLGDIKFVFLNKSRKTKRDTCDQ